MKKWLAELSQRQFVLVTGKGGTGKSVIASALAMYLAAQGKNPLLVEIGRGRDEIFLRLHELIGIPTLHHKPTLVANPLEPTSSFAAARIHPADSLVEYIGIKLHSQRLTNLFFQNRVTTTFLNVVPGLSDLVCLGKLWHTLKNTNSKAPIDMIILDAPASGHALSLLHAPRNFARLTRTGPIFSDSHAMAAFFSNKKNISVLYCSLPEEVPLEETQEYYSLIQKDFPAPSILVNKCFPLAYPPPPIPSASDAPLPIRAAWEYALQRITREREAMARFSSAFPQAKFLPFIFPSESPLNPSLDLAQFFHEARP